MGSINQRITPTLINESPISDEPHLEVFLARSAAQTKSTMIRKITLSDVIGHRKMTPGFNVVKPFFRGKILEIEIFLKKLMNDFEDVDLC